MVVVSEWQVVIDDKFYEMGPWVAVYPAYIESSINVHSIYNVVLLQTIIPL